MTIKDVLSEEELKVLSFALQDYKEKLYSDLDRYNFELGIAIEDNNIPAINIYEKLDRGASYLLNICLSMIDKIK